MGFLAHTLFSLLLIFEGQSSSAATLRSQDALTAVDGHVIEIVGYLGSGEFGDVYLGRTKIGYEYDLVAVKVVKKVIPAGYSRTQIVENYDYIRRNINEHLEIVRVLEASKMRDNYDHEQLVVVTELAEKSVERYLQKTDISFSRKVTMAFDILYQMLKAVSALQKSHRMHNDIHLDNILIRKDGSYALADFDLLTRTDVPMPMYFINPHPNLDSDEQPSSLGDLFDLGKTLVNMLFPGSRVNFSRLNRIDDVATLFYSKRMVISPKEIEKSELLRDYIKAFLSSDPESRLLNAQSITDLLKPLDQIYFDYLTCDQLFAL